MKAKKINKSVSIIIFLLALVSFGTFANAAAKTPQIVSLIPSHLDEPEDILFNTSVVYMSSHSYQRLENGHIYLWLTVDFSNTAYKNIYKDTEDDNTNAVRIESIKWSLASGQSVAKFSDWWGGLDEEAELEIKKTGTFNVKCSIKLSNGKLCNLTKKNYSQALCRCNRISYNK